MLRPVASPLRNSLASLRGLSQLFRPRAAWYDGQQLRRDRWMPEELYDRQTNPDIRRLLVLHSPKTGGSSLRSMFGEHVPADRTFMATGQHQWLHQSAADTRDIELFVGHQFLEPLYRYPDDDWVTVLPIREPLSWWRSWYKWRRQLLHDAGVYTDPIALLNMREWLDTLDDSELSNPQASWLLTRTRIMFDGVAALPGRMTALGGWLWRSPGPAVEVLTRLLDAVTVVGPTEELQTIYVRTCAAMGWEPRFTEARRDNTSEQPDELLRLRPDQLVRLQKLNQIDTWLHTRAREIIAAPPRPIGPPAGDPFAGTRSAARPGPADAGSADPDGDVPIAATPI